MKLVPACIRVQAFISATTDQSVPEVTTAAQTPKDENDSVCNARTEHPSPSLSHRLTNKKILKTELERGKRQRVSLRFVDEEELWYRGTIGGFLGTECRLEMQKTAERGKKSVMNSESEEAYVA